MTKVNILYGIAHQLSVSLGRGRGGGGGGGRGEEGVFKGKWLKANSVGEFPSGKINHAHTKLMTVVSYKQVIIKGSFLYHGLFGANFSYNKCAT